MQLALLVLVLLQWQAGTAIGPMMVGQERGTRLIPPKEREGKEHRGKDISPCFNSSQLKIQHNVDRVMVMCSRQRRGVIIRQDNKSRVTNETLTLQRVNMTCLWLLER
jgi:hypothetical protein